MTIATGLKKKPKSRELHRLQIRINFTFESVQVKNYKTKKINNYSR